MMQQQNGMDPQDQRNFIIAMALMIAFVFLYQVVVVNPEQAARRAAQEQAAAEVQVEPVVPEGVSEVGIAGDVTPATIEDALTNVERITFDVARVDGSIRLKTSEIDDLNLKDHFKTVQREEELRLLRPRTTLEGKTSGYSATWNWSVLNEENAQYFPVLRPQDAWSASSDAISTGETVTLNFERGGIAIEREISIDDDYMFSFEDTITNRSDRAFTLSPNGYVQRYGAWKDFLEETDPGSSRKMGLAHQGLIGIFDTNLTMRNYNNLFKGRGIKDADGTGFRQAEQGGWIGLTDMYWMAALVPEQGRSFKARIQRDETRLELFVDGQDVQVAPGQSITITNQIFAGAKEYETVNAYKTAGIPRFDDSIDWGNILYYITRPFFALLNWLQNQIGSFGLAILALTLLIKIPLIPLYNQSYKSMAKMKKLAEPMKEIQERFKADPQRRQQEVMKLYQREKANPLAGCVPILLTIPVFFALYKTLYVTIEMRHTPFLWLPDLSAAEPLVLGNLFGLLPWASGDEIRGMFIIGFLLGIGILAVLYGVSMAAIQALSPPPPDPTQRRIMMFLPFVFMFVFGGFASGLVLYWVWSNLLSLLQQYYIMRRNGVETELDKLVKRLLNRAEKPAE
ncbi:MAG: membrane protein insertase YidC [Pseudomonadota bacterium]